MRTRTALFLALLLGIACDHSKILPHLSFTEVKRAVDGKTMGEVADLLGSPDFRELILDDEQRWVWWNRAILEGVQYAPEVRGRIVHLEITFQLQPPSPPAAGSASTGEWRVVGPLAVSYTLPTAPGERPRFQGDGSPVMSGAGRVVPGSASARLAAPRR